MGFAEVASSNTWVEILTAASLWQAFVSVLPVWFFGAVVGLLLPRPKWLGGAARSSSLLISIPPGTGLRRLALAFHGAVLVREVWRHFNKPGTFRRFVSAVWSWLSGSGFDFEWPAKFGNTEADVAVDVSKDHPAGSWYITEKDLAFFKYRVEQDGQVPGASDWEVVCEKDVPHLVNYTAWRRTLPNGKTEYKSVTIAPNSTAQEFMDMYLDDNFRSVWDGLITHTEVLEHGDFSHRQQVVRWIRSFPFSFLSKREYVIARQMFDEGDALYCCSKSVKHHRAPPVSSIVRMDVFYSMWKSKTVACPWGSDNPACETVLLHHEQFKIPENLARFAARHGMWGFVKNLGQSVPLFVKARRERAAPHDKDLTAFGHGCSPNPVVAEAAEIDIADREVLDLSDPSAEVTAESTGNSTGRRKRLIRRAVGVAAFVALLVLKKRVCK